MRLPILLAALLLTLPARADTPPDCAGVPCAGGPVQEESPFLWRGRMLSDHEVHDRVRATYGPIVERYPDAASCLEGGLPPGADIRSRTLRWHHLQSEQEVDVCLFRVFARIGDLGEIRDWLVKEGFERPLFRDRSGTPNSFNQTGGSITQLEIYWSTKRKGARYGNEEVRHNLERLTRSMSVDVIHADRTGVVSVRVGGYSKWAK